MAKFTAYSQLKLMFLLDELAEVLGENTCREMMRFMVGK